MRTYLFNIIPRLRQFSNELDNTSLLTSKHWVVLDEAGHQATYIFRPNGDLLISQEGHVYKAKWDYIGNQTLLIDRGEKSYLFKHGFLNEDVLAMKVDGKDEYAVFVTDSQFERGLTSLESVAAFLEANVLSLKEKALLPQSAGSTNPNQQNHGQADAKAEEDANLQIVLVLMAVAIVIIFTIVIAGKN